LDKIWVGTLKAVEFLRFHKQDCGRGASKMTPVIEKKMMFDGFVHRMWVNFSAIVVYGNANRVEELDLFRSQFPREVRESSMDRVKCVD
jgi:hypothetical protein